jgi:hypothetical protein
MDMDVIRHGIEPFRNGNEDRFPGLVELYLTFTPDGKVKFDLFNVNSGQPDQEVTHLQDMGWPIVNYPQQIAPNPPWKPAVAWPFDSIYVGGRLPGSPHVVQMQMFGRILSNNEILGFHSRNVFFGGTNKASVRHITLGQEPCNTGDYLNHPPGLFVETVCGKRDGQGQRTFTRYNRTNHGEP